jgi:hypothetical protein
MLTQMRYNLICLIPVEVLTRTDHQLKSINTFTKYVSWLSLKRPKPVKAPRLTEPITRQIQFLLRDNPYDSLIFMDFLVYLFFWITQAWPYSSESIDSQYDSLHNQKKP